MSGRARQRLCVAFLAILPAFVLVTPTRGKAVAAGTLTLDAELAIAYPAIPCPAGTSRQVECFARAGNSVVPGLGTVEESYAYVLENAPPGCAARLGADIVRLPPATARLTVPGKGEIDVRTGGTGCLARAGSLTATESFTITGGSGVYTGATGGGTVTTQSYGPPSFRGIDTWNGTLVAPGVQFDLTTPTINGAVAKTVRVARRAKRARVNYMVTAQDDIDGLVPVACALPSGSRFELGRTRVACSATDTSGNTAEATFTVTVKRKR